MVEAQDDPIRPGRLLLLGGLLAVVFLLLVALVVVRLFGLAVRPGSGPAGRLNSRRTLLAREVTTSHHRAHRPHQ